MTKKLYRVVTRIPPTATGVDYSSAYVVAVTPSEAYAIYRAFLDRNNIGFSRDRCLDRVELIAEECDYPECGTLLLRGSVRGGKDDN